MALVTQTMAHKTTLLDSGVACTAGTWSAAIPVALGAKAIAGDGTALVEGTLNQVSFHFTAVSNTPAPTTATIRLCPQSSNTFLLSPEGTVDFDVGIASTSVGTAVLRGPLYGPLLCSAVSLDEPEGILYAFILLADGGANTATATVTRVSSSVTKA